MSQQSVRLIGLVLTFAAMASTAALAQDEPRFALVTSFPSPTVSFQWEVSERVALRVESSYTYRDESSDSITGQGSITDQTGNRFVLYESVAHTESRSHTGSIGLAGIITIHRGDQLRLYVAPRISLLWSSQRVSVTSETRSAGVLPPGAPVFTFDTPPRSSETLEESSTSPAAGVSFGAAMNFHRRLALFGEAGFTYSRSDTPLFPLVLGGSLRSPGESRRTTINTRAVGGVMFLF
jgi:hypothetical protein